MTIKKRRTAGLIERKWRSLVHQGPLFSPEYKPLPSKVKLKYDGRRVGLNPNAEECAKFYAQVLSQDCSKNKNFNLNFFMDLRRFLTSKEKKVIREFSRCDFSDIHAYIMKEREAKNKKNLSAREKEKLKDKQREEVEKYGWCLVDGKREKLGNFRMEPPGIFRGQGNHPLMGRIKERVLPEEVTINCSRGQTPRPPRGHKWKAVIHNKKVAWLASWKDKLVQTNKYIWMNRGSTIHSKAEREKFHLAEQLGQNINRVRKQYRKDLSSKDLVLRQTATVVYLIDTFGLRIGNEKKEDKADTVGCCTLRKRNMGFPKNDGNKTKHITLDFLGKDSIEFKKTLLVDKVVWKNIKEFVKGKQTSAMIFDAISSKNVNDYLTNMMPRLTAKVFRTYNSSLIFENALMKLSSAEESLAAKLDAFNKANLQVAEFCNHRKTVPKNFDESLKKLDQKIKKLKKDLRNVERDLKKFKKGSSEFQKRRNRLERIKTSISKWENAREHRIRCKGIALQTSKQNYIDPRIIYAWCKSNEVPVNKVYNKSQLEKFRWAEDKDEDFVFDS